MNYTEYLRRVDELKKQNIKVGSFDFSGQNPIEFLKVEIIEEEITAAAFHWQDKWMNVGGKWKKEKSIVDWDKNYVLMLGGLCGIESDFSKSEKMGKYSYLSKATLYRILPSGKREYESAEYEFDAEVRAEEVVLKNQIKYMEYEEKKSSNSLGRNDREVKQKYKSDFEKQLVVVEMAKYGRQRADTGAHKRAIVKMIKLPSASEELIGTRLFCFQCIPDFSNENVRQKYLQGDNPANSIFGTAQIEYKEEDVIDQPETPSAIFQIAEKRELLKSRPALYKLAGIVLEAETHAEEFLGFLKDFNNIQDKASATINWLNKFETVDGLLLDGTAEAKSDFLKKWGNG